MAAPGSFAGDVRRGLLRPGQKTLPCKYFYDAAGTALFEAITQLPEYGLAAADAALLRDHSAAIAEAVLGGATGPVMVAELGSGSGRKTRPLLAALCARAAVHYCPIEISASALLRCRAELSGLAGLEYDPIAAEFLDGLEAMDARRAARSNGSPPRLLLLFLGSGYGNFSPREGREFLRQVRARLLPGDALLLGLDMVKPLALLRPAYDDPAGVTAAFNRNLLARINRELQGNFALARFRHVIRYRADAGRLEMHLLAVGPQRVSIPGAGCAIRLAANETIRTECCHKFRPADIDALAAAAGFVRRRCWTHTGWSFTENLLLAVE